MGPHGMYRAMTVPRDDGTGAAGPARWDRNHLSLTIHLTRVPQIA